MCEHVQVPKATGKSNPSPPFRVRCTLGRPDPTLRHGYKPPCHGGPRDTFFHIWRGEYRPPRCVFASPHGAAALRCRFCSERRLTAPHALQVKVAARPSRGRHSKALRHEPSGRCVPCHRSPHAWRAAEAYFFCGCPETDRSHVHARPIGHADCRLLTFGSVEVSRGAAERRR